LLVSVVVTCYIRLSLVVDAVIGKGGIWGVNLVREGCKVARFVTKQDRVGCDIVGLLVLVPLFKGTLSGSCLVLSCLITLIQSIPLLQVVSPDPTTPLKGVAVIGIVFLRTSTTPGRQSPGAVSTVCEF
jgi:hypothetical protein